MADVTLYEGETRFVRFPITANADPLTDTVQIAFIGEGAAPVTADWHTAVWVAGQTWTAGQPVYAGAEIGPTALAVPPGTYNALLRIVGAPPDEPWIPAGTIRIRAVIPTTALRDIRAEIGGAPADDEIADLYAVHGQSVPATALAVLRPRLADALTAAASGGVTIPGVISVTAPANPQYLRDQISRLEAAIVTPGDDIDGEEATAGIGRLTRRSQRRGMPWSL